MAGRICAVHAAGEDRDRGALNAECGTMRGPIDPVRSLPASAVLELEYENGLPWRRTDASQTRLAPALR